MRFELRRADVGPDVSWAVAADRAAARLGQVSGPVLAVDLSGDPLVFGVDEQHRFAVRPMTEGDLPSLVRWVNAAHVARWWDDDRSPDEVAAHYGPALSGQDPTRLWIWEVNGRSVGFAQDYRIADYPDYGLVCGRPDAIGFDYLIGEPAYAGRGLGTSLLWVLLRDIVTPAYSDAGELFAAPDHRNHRSLRVLRKVGATEGVWFDEPHDPARPGGRQDTVIGHSIDVARVMGRSVTGK
ncbi:GNAT family N-acetyltransferase [Nocardioides terrisoli]|uniref:GNAT family N-acetyltransferase n=1 Tax=Nocardioides terrisoli TaxID=3388267 RepID=UPI00287B875E|nr:GNAT family N-acetyltransferase [Nocardioides marmorisolisilvae]